MFNKKEIKKANKKEVNKNNIIDSKCIDINNPTMGMEDEMLLNSENIIEEDTRVLMMRSPRCPIFFDEGGRLMNIPSPHDVVIERLRNTLKEVEQFRIYDNIDFMGPVNMFQLERDVHTVVADTYRDSISAAIVSYLNDRLLYNYSYNDRNDYLDGIQRMITDCVYIDSYRLTTIIDGTVNDFMSLISSDLSNEDRNKVMFGITETATNCIMSHVANSLGELNMRLSFDKSSTTDKDVYEVDRAKNKKAYLQDISEESYDGRKITDQLFYFLNSCEFTTQLYGMSGLVNALIYQIYSTLIYILDTSPSLVKYMKDNYKANHEKYLSYENPEFC